MQCFSLRTFVIWEFYLALSDRNQIRAGFQHLLKRGNARHRLHCREKDPARHVPAHSSFFTLSWGTNLHLPLFGSKVTEPEGWLKVGGVLVTRGSLSLQLFRALCNFWRKHRPSTFTKSAARCRGIPVPGLPVPLVEEEWKRRQGAASGSAQVTSPTLCLQGLRSVLGTCFKPLLALGSRGSWSVPAMVPSHHRCGGSTVTLMYSQQCL